MTRPAIIARPPFIVTNWYWYVAGDMTRAYSSAVGDYVPSSDPTFQAWLAGGNTATTIDSEANLGTVSGLPRPVNANVLIVWQAAKASAIDQIQFKILFNHENRIRVLEQRAQITAQQFLNAIANLL